MNDEEIDFTDAAMLRRKAEELLKKKQKETSTQEKDADVKRLLHELQVHQIELEMQNEELRQAYETAETALKKYTMLYDFAPMGYFTLDSECNICELNFTGADMLGQKRFSLVNKNFKLFVAENSRPAFNDFFRNVYSRNEKESCQLMLGYDKQALRFVYMDGVVTDVDRKCLLSVIDISDFKRDNI